MTAVWRLDRARRWLGRKGNRYSTSVVAAGE